MVRFSIERSLTYLVYYYNVQTVAFIVVSPLLNMWEIMLLSRFAQKRHPI